MKDQLGVSLLLFMAENVPGPYSGRNYGFDLHTAHSRLNDLPYCPKSLTPKPNAIGFDYQVPRTSNPKRPLKERQSLSKGERDELLAAFDSEELDQV
jgi:hypothetical protein